MKNKKFTDIRLRLNTLDLYYQRKSIFKAIQENIGYFRGKLIDIGCGKMPYKNYILKNSEVIDYTGLDIHTHYNYSGEQPDITWDGEIIPISSNSYDCAFLTEVFEHCFDPVGVMCEIYRILKPGGFLFFTSPFLWPLHEVPHDHYRYTPFSLQRHLAKCGFIDIELKPLGGWDASMAQMVGLWVRRRKMGELQRLILSIIFMPVISLLLKKDKSSITEIEESSMITGLCGIARVSKIIPSK